MFLNFEQHTFYAHVLFCSHADDMLNQWLYMITINSYLIWCLGSSPGLLLLWRYNSDRVVAFSTISFHLRQSWTYSAHFINFIFFKSFLTSSHRYLGLPAGLPVNGFHLCIHFYYAGFRHSIYVFEPTQSLSFNIIYYVMVFY